MLNYECLILNDSQIISPPACKTEAILTYTSGETEIY